MNAIPYHHSQNFFSFADEVEIAVVTLKVKSLVETVYSPGIESRLQMPGAGTYVFMNHNAAFRQSEP